jgi:non-ribosomal peptide synthetase component E (peptide arylation enzyme)
MYTRPGDSIEVLDWTVGTPISSSDEVRLVEPGTEIDVSPGEIGEFICRGPYTLWGYFNAPERNQEAFTKDGFYRTGDLLVQREINGQWYYAFAGRTKDVVDRGSEKVNCEEIEAAVSTYATVAGCAVVGMPDPVLGERICAYIVTKGGSVPPGVADLAQHLEQIGLAKFKWPERVEVVDELPLTRVGKLDKAVLRARIRESLAREGVDVQ